MKVLVTGAGGQLGREIQKLSIARGLACVATDSRVLDITDPAKVRSMVASMSPDIVINCAAYNAVDRAENEWKSAFRINGLAVKNLVLAANKAGAVLVHYSTDYVFDGKTSRPYTIVDSPNPISRYGESKLLGEQIVRDLADRFFLIRTSWVFGAGNANFVKKLLEWSNEKDEMKVVDDQTASPTYTADLASATLDLVKTEAFGLYHITNAGSCSRYEWAAYVLQKIGWKGSLLPAKSREFNSAAKRPEYSVLDNFGLAETLGHILPHWKDATSRFLAEREAMK